MPKHRSHSIEFKRQVAQEFLRHPDFRKFISLRAEPRATLILAARITLANLLLQH
jgi:hypothetical protein